MAVPPTPTTPVFDPRSTYTGTHSNGGPEHVAKGGREEGGIRWMSRERHAYLIAY